MPLTNDCIETRHTDLRASALEPTCTRAREKRGAVIIFPCASMDITAANK